MKLQRFTLQLLFVVNVFFIQSSVAQNSILLNFKNQNPKTFLFSTLTKITFSNSLIVFNLQNATTESYALTDVSKLTFDSNTGVNDVILTNNELSIYPNPVKSIVFIKGLNEKTTLISIYKMNGMLVFKSNINDIDSSIDLSKLSSGLYLAKINNQTFKISKQ